MLESALAFRLYRRTKRAIRPQASYSIFDLPEFTIRAHRFKRDYVSADIALNRIWEPLESEIIIAMLSPGETFCDIGANLGWYTVLAARRVGAAGRVVSFEPDPDNFRLLQQNIELNNLENVTPYLAALSDTAGTGILFKSSENPGDHRLNSSTPGRRGVEVQVLDLSDLIKSLPPPDFLKIDVQGSEAKILTCAPELYRLSPRLVMILEFWPWGLANCGSSYIQMLEILKALPVDIFMIDEATRTFIPTSCDDLKARCERYLSEEDEFINLITVPKSGRIALPTPVAPQRKIRPVSKENPDFLQAFRRSGGYLGAPVVRVFSRIEERSSQNGRRTSRGRAKIDC